MTAKPSPFGYSVFDFLTRIIPGLVVVTPLAVSYVTLGPRVDVGYQPVLIGLAVVGLVIGEVIDLVRSSLFRVPLPFKQVLYRHTDNREILSRFDRCDLWLQAKMPEALKPNFITEEVGRGTLFDGSSEDFQEEYESHFGLKFEETHPGLLYLSLLSHMDSRMSSDTRRYYTLRIFAQNLMFAALFTIFTSLAVIVANLENAGLILVATLSIFLLAGFFYLGMIISSVAYPFVDRLIIDYYVERLK